MIVDRLWCSRLDSSTWSIAHCALIDTYVDERLGLLERIASRRAIGHDDQLDLGALLALLVYLGEIVANQRFGKLARDQDDLYVDVYRSPRERLSQRRLIERYQQREIPVKPARSRSSSWYDNKGRLAIGKRAFGSSLSVSGYILLPEPPASSTACSSMIDRDWRETSIKRRQQANNGFRVE